MRYRGSSGGITWFSNGGCLTLRFIGTLGCAEKIDQYGITRSYSR